MHQLCITCCIKVSIAMGQYACGCYICQLVHVVSKSRFKCICASGDAKSQSLTFAADLNACLHCCRCSEAYRPLKARPRVPCFASQVLWRSKSSPCWTFYYSPAAFTQDVQSPCGVPCIRDCGRSSWSFQTPKCHQHHPLRRWHSRGP